MHISTKARKVWAQQRAVTRWNLRPDSACQCGEADVLVLSRDHAGAVCCYSCLTGHLTEVHHVEGRKVSSVVERISANEHRRIHAAVGWGELSHVA